MRICNRYPLILALLLLSVVTSVRAQPLNDGYLFDQGIAFTERSPRAPEALDKMKSILGQWDVEVTTYTPDAEPHVAAGMAEITYMIRGYAYMSRIHVPAYNGSSELNVLQFLNFSPTHQAWVLGEANSYTEHIALYDGELKANKLSLATAIRKGGTPALTHIRIDYTMNAPDAFTVTRSEKSSRATTWTKTEKQVFTRREPSDDFMQTRSDEGKPGKNRPPESRQFDFLIGQWQANHKMNIGGQNIQFPANATAVYVMNGHAILEHGWYDVDPSLPDAATSIIRLYNRAMRRWESLYLTNRGNSQLFFGGRQEGNQVVLHNFEANTTDAVISRYVFHDIGSDTYSWYGENSTDRGQSFNTFWEISFTKK